MKKSHHVVPNQSGGWDVRKPGASRASRVFESKKDAVDYARNIAKKENSELYIHRKDGTISHRGSYSLDRLPPKDKK